MTKLQGINLALRGLMEASIVLGLAYWGYQSGTGTAMRIILALLAPMLVFGFWGAVDFHQAGKLAEPLRLFQELALSGLVVVALYTAGQHTLGLAFGALSIFYHGLVYLSGGTLLKHSAMKGEN